MTTLPNFESSLESFANLLSLNVTGGDKSLLAQLCRTPAVTHLTKLAARVRASTQEDITTTTPFAQLTAHIPQLQELKLYGKIYPDNSNVASLHPPSLQILVLSGSDGAGPELSRATLSSLSSTLEVLELDNYVSLGTIMHLSLCLPRLKHLKICFDPHSVPDTIYTAHLSGTSLEIIRSVWLSHSFTLMIRSDPWETPGTVELDICAK